jgi:hypothetical protein
LLNENISVEHGNKVLSLEYVVEESFLNVLSDGSLLLYTSLAVRYIELFAQRAPIERILSMIIHKANKLRNKEDQLAIYCAIGHIISPTNRPHFLESIKDTSDPSVGTKMLDFDTPALRDFLDRQTRNNSSITDKPCTLVTAALYLVNLTGDVQKFLS